ncbi:hypothetical protein BDZ91DRAFT_479048 [Kalaharituber pfeilii]|nr:hypothetical protein BDZ91DRAFT_479048 [Kalaharituber pfeilii]
MLEEMSIFVLKCREFECHPFFVFSNCYEVMALTSRSKLHGIKSSQSYSYGCAYFPTNRLNISLLFIYFHLFLVSVVVTAFPETVRNLRFLRLCAS